MKTFLFTTLFALALVFAIGPVWAADLSGAQGTVDRIRQPDPPQVSTTTKPSVNGIPASQFQPPVNPKYTQPHSVPAPQPKTEVPRTTYNPQGSAAVQNGYNQNQAAHPRPAAPAPAPAVSKSTSTPPAKK